MCAEIGTKQSKFLVLGLRLELSLTKLLFAVRPAIQLYSMATFFFKTLIKLGVVPNIDQISENKNERRSNKTIRNFPPTSPVL